MAKENTMVECCECGTEYDSSESGSDYNGSPICDDCSRFCERCESTTTRDYAYLINGRFLWCEDCKDANAFYCCGCQEYYDSYNVGSHYFDNGDYCDECISEIADYCERCEEWESSENYCGNMSNDSIKSYSYKPDPIFIGESKSGLYMGWELEADCPSYDRDECADYASPILEGIAYIKEDSSVQRGLEIVTHPIAHNKVRELSVYWDTIEELRSTYGMRSWDSELSCGLHIHLSRRGFSGVAHIHKFMRLIYGNAELMAKFAGRTSQYSSFQDVWCFNEFGVPYRKYAQKISHKRRSGGERNSAVNTHPENTIELRFFRGTMNKSGILACLDLAQACVEYTRNLTAKDVMAGGLGWEYLYDYIERNNGLYPDAYSRMPKVQSINLANREVINA